MEVKRMDKNKIMSPISFGNKNGVVPAIQFIKKPISYIAKQQIECGAYVKVETDDERLANASIPYGIKEEDYVLFIENLKQGKMQSVPIGKVVQENEIIRAQEKTKMPDAISNYEIIPIEKRVYIDGRGNVQLEKNDIDIRVRIKTCNGITEERMNILYTKLSNVTQIISKRFPSAIVYDKKNTYKIENALREQIAGIREIKIYTCAGWQEIDRQKVYIHKSQQLKNARVSTELNLLSCNCYTKNDLAGIYRNAIELYDMDGTAAALVAYSLLGVSYRIFDEAGFAPHFLLFINGKTGSFKTAISKVLYIQLVDDEHREFPRRIDADTVTSFERALVESGRDTVTLYDDYAPAKTLQNQRILDSKLEVIIRMIGDGSTKSRSNVALEDKKGEGVKGAVVLTGELRGKGLSSNLRCLYCGIEKEYVNKENLSWLQKNKYAYTTFIQHYVYFLAQRWDVFVKEINEKFEEKRAQASKVLKAGRSIDTLVTLWLLMDMLKMFLIQYCQQDEIRISNEIEYLKQKLTGVVYESELVSEEEDPATIFMSALGFVLEKNILYIISKADLTDSNKRMIDGCEDEENIYLIPDTAYKNVVGWLRSTGIEFSLDLPRLGEMLCQAGYAVATSNGVNKKTYYARLSVANGKKISFLKIPKSIITKFQEKIGESK
jgi:hypothetical protein